MGIDLYIAYAGVEDVALRVSAQDTSLCTAFADSQYWDVQLGSIDRFKHSFTPSGRWVTMLGIENCNQVRILKCIV